MLVSTCNVFAADLDFSSLSDDELNSVISSARNELLSRECILNENTVFLANDICELYIDNSNDIKFENGYLKIPVICINNAEEEMSFQFDYVKVNGWDCGGNIGNAAGESKKKAVMQINCKDIGVEGVDDIEDIVMTVIGFNMGTFTRDAEGEEVSFIINQ